MSCSEKGQCMCLSCSVDHSDQKWHVDWLSPPDTEEGGGAAWTAFPMGLCTSVYTDGRWKTAAPTCETLFGATTSQQHSQQNKRQTGVYGILGNREGVEISVFMWSGRDRGVKWQQSSFWTDAEKSSRLSKNTSDTAKLQQWLCKSTLGI